MGNLRSPLELLPTLTNYCQLLPTFYCQLETSTDRDLSLGNIYPFGSVPGRLSHCAFRDQPLVQLNTIFQGLYKYINLSFVALSTKQNAPYHSLNIYISLQRLKNFQFKIRSLILFFSFKKMFLFSLLNEDRFLFKLSRINYINFSPILRDEGSGHFTYFPAIYFLWKTGSDRLQYKENKI